MEKLTERELAKVGAGLAAEIAADALKGCGKCGRKFTSSAQFRYNAKGQPICRKPCREVAR